MDLDQSPWRVVAQFVDDIRASFNRSVDHLESWQIVLYTLSLILFVQWVRKITKSEEATSPRKWVSGDALYRQR